MKDMIGYCGLDCEKCDAFLATLHDDQALREKTAKLWGELNQAPILPEHINCEGCRVDGVKTFFCDSLCGVRQCALKKGVTTLRGLPGAGNMPDASKNNLGEPGHTGKSERIDRLGGSFLG